MMNCKHIALACLLTLSTSAVFAQNGDAIVFEVGDMEVPVSEFIYIYEKNNRDDADYSRASVEEYLDLYVRFKLKVKEAYDMQLDTVQALQRELEGYRKQLAKSFLIDRNVTDKLVVEVHERMLEDIRLSHILVKFDPSAGVQMRERARDHAAYLHGLLEEGAEFDSLARAESQDRSSAERGGDLGFVTAMLPSGFYAFETTAYNLDIGEYSEPVETTLGYHIILLTDRRPARGMIEVAHILSRVNEDGSNEQAAKMKIDGIYNRLQQGENFEDLAKSVSDDDKTARRGGYIGKVGINRFDPVFEDVAFSLKDGEYSEPVKSRLGWHIIKLIKHIPPGTLDEERRQIEARLAGNERIAAARVAMVESIKEESNYTVNDKAYDEIVGSLGADFQTFQWQIPEVESKPLLYFNGKPGKSNVDFIKYLESQTRLRMRSQGIQTPAELAEDLFQEFVEEACLEYAEGQLTEKYPEFAALMREYEEGILLFEVTKLNVWDHAGSDTTGLKAYFEEHKDQYMWPERADVVEYTVNSGDIETRAKAMDLSASEDPVSWAERLNKKEQIASFSRSKVDRVKLEEMGLSWEEGWMSTPSNSDSTLTFKRVLNITPPEHKKLEEARGYVIADYQDYLEKQWVEALRKKYEVDIRTEVVESLIRN